MCWTVRYLSRLFLKHSDLYHLLYLLVLFRVTEKPTDCPWSLIARQVTTQDWALSHHREQSLWATWKQQVTLTCFYTLGESQRTQRRPPNDTGRIWKCHTHEPMSQRCKGIAVITAPPRHHKCADASHKCHSHCHISMELHTRPF